MTHTELQNLQKRIKFDAPSMAKCLNIPYHTYRNYLYGANEIPAHIEEAAIKMEQYQKECDLKRERDHLALLDQMYPHGFMSEMVVEA